MIKKKLSIHTPALLHIFHHIPRSFFLYPETIMIGGSPFPSVAVCTVGMLVSQWHFHFAGAMLHKHMSVSVIFLFRYYHSSSSHALHKDYFSVHGKLHSRLVSKHFSSTFEQMDHFPPICISCNHHLSYINVCLDLREHVAKASKHFK